MDFQLTSEQQRLQNKCRELAFDFATRAAAHDRDASHPVENYDRLRKEGFLALTIGKEWGGLGASFLDHTIAYEVLGEGCPSTALAFNMHASVVMPLLESAEVSAETKRRIADLVVQHRKLIAGNFSEPVTTSLIGERPLKARARRADGGYRVIGRKMFASMLEAADFVLVMAYPDEATSPSAGIILMLPRGTEGRRVDSNWDVLGMRATRSDSLILDECWLPYSAAVLQSDDMRPFRYTYLNWFWGSYTPVYLGVAQAAFDELRRVVHTRQPEGYAQPLAYHPDVRRHVAEMSADLEAARLITYRSAWLSDTEGATAQDPATSSCGTHWTVSARRWRPTGQGASPWPAMATPRRRTGEASRSGVRRSMALTIQSAPAASARTTDEPGLSSCSSIRSGASWRSRPPCRFAALGPRNAMFHETTRTLLIFAYWGPEIHLTGRTAVRASPDAR